MPGHFMLVTCDKEKKKKIKREGDRTGQGGVLKFRLFLEKASQRSSLNDVLKEVAEQVMTEQEFSKQRQ